MSGTIHRVIAVNEPGSSNLVHDDEFARKLGFDRGLVPGVTVYGYMTAVPARQWGDPWRQRGSMYARFLKPVYDGQEVTVTGVPTDDGVDIELRDPAGQLCAVGSASPDPVGEPVSTERYSAAPLPSPVQPPAFLDDQVLGSVETRLRVDDFSWPARCGNEILMANVTLPPWIHVETRTRHLGPVRDGEAATVRGRVSALWERRGHRFVELDVLVLGERSPVAQLRHVAIYELAQLRASKQDSSV